MRRMKRESASNAGFWSITLGSQAPLFLGRLRVSSLALLSYKLEEKQLAKQILYIFGCESKI